VSVLIFAVGLGASAAAIGIAADACTHERTAAGRWLSRLHDTLSLPVGVAWCRLRYAVVPARNRRRAVQLLPRLVLTGALRRVA
jgi:hypothetical protein